MKVLVLGASGQLGQCLARVAADRKLDYLVFPDENMANILDQSSLATLFNDIKPSYVINCAAYTAVDKAEDDVEICRKVNKDGPSIIAHLCKEFSARLIHVSTDFVFDGTTPVLLNEEDTANPINVYGLTKLEGEAEIMNTLPEHYILRTSWLYSEFGNNFVKVMLKLGSERSELKIIADQIGTPTYAIDLASAILTIIESGRSDYGVYHYSNEGVTSWYDFAQGIFDISNSAVKVLPIPTSEYPTRAVRPKFSVMDKSKFKDTFNVEIPYWRDSLIECIKQLNIQRNTN